MSFKDDKELKLLLQMVRPSIDGDWDGNAPDLVTTDIDWERCYTLARNHRLTPLMNRAIQYWGVELLNEELAKKVASDSMAIAMEVFSYIRELHRLRDAFSVQGLKILVIKGPALGAKYYADATLRPFGDLDLLVQRPNMLRAKDVLLQSGYHADPPMSPQKEQEFLRTERAYEFYHDTNGFKVELHSALAHKGFRIEWDTDDLLDRAQEISIGNAPFKTLDDTDLLYFLCVHGTKHEWNQLVWVRDVAGLLHSTEEIDWNRLLASAKRKNSQRMVFLGLFLASELFDSPLPVEIRQKIKSDEEVLGILADYVCDNSGQENRKASSLRSEIYFHTRTRKQRKEKLMLALEKTQDRLKKQMMGLRAMVTASDADRSFLDLPKALTPLYIIVRPVRVLRDLLKRSPKDE